MKKVIIYHNPRCSKSREALNLLYEKQIEPVIVLYLQHPLNEKQILTLQKKLSLPLSEMIRKNEKIYKSSLTNIINPSLDQILKILVAHPILLQRPIVETDTQARIGRPPENILDIL